jgi:hypothetical protein
MPPSGKIQQMFTICSNEQIHETGQSNPNAEEVTPGKEGSNRHQHGKEIF